MAVNEIIQIDVQHLRVTAIIGEKSWERRNKQEVLIDFSFRFDASKVMRSDSISDTIDYESVSNRIVDEVSRSKYRLIERLAKHVVELILEDRRVLDVTVRIAKPKALSHAELVWVTATGRGGDDRPKRRGK